MLSSTGGFLKKKSVTLLIGVERAQVDTVLEILEKHAKKSISRRLS
ncbi:MAG: cyclic-di-AMP receptor [Clostridiales bacterium]|nr:MAG: cyclic-di-AMP receptor [Clostridiales bacterium]